MSVTLKDFQPINKWKIDPNGQKFNDGENMEIIDQTTGRRYLNDSKGTVRVKCFLTMLGTPIVHTIATIANIVYRIFKLVSFSHFWLPKKGEESYNFKAKLTEAAQDFAPIIAQPFAILGLELASLYGLFSPYDGRKLFASIERSQYENWILAPCFQPEAQKHLFGGNIRIQNTY